MGAPSTEDALLARIFKEESGGVLSVLISQLKDFDLAEDALQDAITEALVAWRRDGLPRNGAGWLLTAARRRAIDRIRRSVTARNEVNQQVLIDQLELNDDPAEDEHPIPDERLRLIFTCCHPALNEDAQVALTLQSLCGLSSTEIAHAYLVSPTTMQQRIVRAKKRIRDIDIPYEVPELEQLDERLDAVLGVLYLIFNEGFEASHGRSPTRSDLCVEAIRLCRVLYQLMPKPETGGLLALMLLHDARRPARTDESGAYVALADQDRTLWDQDLIQQGLDLLLYCLGQHRPVSFQLQAAISGVHASAASTEETDWQEIAGLYVALSLMTPTPVVMLNRAVAISHAQSPEAGLEMLDSVSVALEDYQPLYAARADLLRRAGRTDEAKTAYRKAIELTDNESERAFLEARTAELTPTHD